LRLLQGRAPRSEAHLDYQVAAAFPGVYEFLMINNLAELEPIEVAGIKLGDQCFEIHVHGALVEVPSYDEDEHLDLASCARADFVPEEARPAG